jgi:hypothetical protein
VENGHTGFGGASEWPYGDEIGTKLQSLSPALQHARAVGIMQHASTPHLHAIATRQHPTFVSYRNPPAPHICILSQHFCNALSTCSEIIPIGAIRPPEKGVLNKKLSQWGMLVCMGTMHRIGQANLLLGFRGAVAVAVRRHCVVSGREGQPFQDAWILLLDPLSDFGSDPVHVSWYPKRHPERARVTQIAHVSARART